MIFSYSDDREVWNVVHLEDGVGDAGEGSPVRDGVYPEHVHAPLLRILQDLQLVINTDVASIEVMKLYSWMECLSFSFMASNLQI